MNASARFLISATSKKLSVVDESDLPDTILSSTERRRTFVPQMFPLEDLSADR